MPLNPALVLSFVGALSKARCSERGVFGGGGRRLAKGKLAAEVLIVGGHGEGKAHFFGKEGLRAGFVGGSMLCWLGPPL